MLVVPIVRCESGFWLGVFANKTAGTVCHSARRVSQIVCYTGRMFIHRIFVMGCSDRGAWPWRTLPPVTEHA
jgi:hypothetical protein